MIDLRPMELMGVAAAAGLAVRSGILEAVCEAPHTIEALAARLQLDRGALALLADVLVAAGVLERAGEQLCAAAVFRATAAAHPVAAARQLMMWEGLEGFLQGRPRATAADGAPAERAENYREGVKMLAALFGPHARALAARLAPAPRSVLDVGCGSGVWGLAFAELYPAATVTGLDLPAVLQAFEARAAQLGVGSRARTLPGSAFERELPKASFDLILIANLLHLEGPERARSLVGRLAAALAPGGRLVVVDSLAPDGPERAVSRAVYALSLGLRTRGGVVHPPEEITAWLREAGLPRVQRVDLPPEAGPLGALVGAA